jgi:hypothetical protein
VEKIIKISANLSSAKFCLSLIYISLHFQYWETDDLIKAISQKCYLQNYNGEWKTVQDFLETELKTPKEFEEKYISVKGPHDFFGNFLPKASRNIKLLKIKDLQKKDKRKVLYPQFHRGYKDKGSLRLPSEYHGDRPLKTEKEDRRSKVAHPLLGEDFYTVEESVLDTHLRKEEDLCFI